MHTKRGMHQIEGIMLFFSLVTLSAGLLAGNFIDSLHGVAAIIQAPAQLTMDAFMVGGIGGAFLNAGLVGLACTAVFTASKSKHSGVSLMAYFLTLGFSFFGMDIINIWPCILGTWLYTRVRHVPFATQVNSAFFSASLSPFVSEMLWRYPLFDGLPGEPVIRIFAAVLIGMLAGFLMPILCSHSPNLHKGYSLYNAAAVAGYIAVLLYAVLYHAVGVTVPSNTKVGEPHVYGMTLFMVVVCSLMILIGYIANGASLKGYSKIFFCSGYRTDFTRTLGIPLTMVHIGVFGLIVTLYYYLIGAPMSGPTMGSIICLLAIAPCGGHLLNVLPIAIGYWLAALCFPFQINAQSLVVGFSFACALCQIAGHFGALCGVLAGFLHACLVTTVVSFHAGFCLYNGGFTSGICAIILVPILETFFIPTDRLHLMPHFLKHEEFHRRHGHHEQHGHHESHNAKH